MKHEKQELSAQEIQTALAELEDWSQEDARIRKTWAIKPYFKAVAFVNQIAWLAQMQNHHPEIELSWGRVAVSITSHDVGALTERDFNLARAIEDLDKDF